MFVFDNFGLIINVKNLIYREYIVFSVLFWVLCPILVFPNLRARRERNNSIFVTPITHFSENCFMADETEFDYVIVDLNDLRRVNSFNDLLMYWCVCIFRGCRQVHELGS